MPFELPFVKRERVSRYSAFSLTPAGQKRAEEFGSSPMDRVLSALDELKSGTVEEIATESRMRAGQVERMLRILSRNGYVHMVRGEE